MDKTGDIEQAGRAESSLSAERNSAQLRSKASSLLARHDSSGSTPQRRSSTSSQTQPLAPVLSRRALYVPAVLSPLNPSSSQSSDSSNDEKIDIEEESSPVESSSSNEVPQLQNTGNVPSTTRTMRKSRTLSPVQQILRHKAGMVLRPEGVAPETPRTLRDLGRDYSRYPLSSPGLRSNSRPPGEKNRPAGRPSLLRTTTNNPFSDSQANLEKWGYPDDSLGAFNPYYGGEKGFIRYNNEIEADDKYHMPADDDDEVYKAKWSDHFTRQSACSTVGGIFMIIGLLCIFIVLPVLTFSTNTFLPGAGKYKWTSSAWTGPAWAHVNNNTYALLDNVRRGLIDPDTPASAKTRTSTFDGSTLNLVFSDEFNQDNRTFYPGDDPFWTGANLWYGATQDMEWYDPVAITTGGGTLQLTLASYPNHNLQFQSGMLNSWNQLCFKGGVFEVSASLARPGGVPGLWPGIWTLGNLGRPGYKSTTEGIWPYTYNSCDAGITPNQSDPDGVSYLPGQKLPSCTCTGADHPNPGTGRGAPEIDIFEASVDPTNKIGVVTQSFQVAPFDRFWQPNANFLALPNYNTTQMNGYTGSPYQQAISATTLLNNNWYNGTQYQKYAFEYIPGTSTGKIAWFVGEDPSFIMDGRAIGPNGNIGARLVSEEPMSMVLNLGISSAWGEILFGDLVFPTTMYIDYVRIYQKEGQEIITCDPPGYPTTEYIQNHPGAYNNPNLTVYLPFRLTKK